MGFCAKGIRSALRFMAGLFLLLNLCIATIPRCDHVLAVIQHTLNQDLSETASCHDHGNPNQVAFQDGHVCQCHLVKFVFVTLPGFNPESFIQFRVQTSTLIQFDYASGPSSHDQGPEPPYPRWTLV
ncbi:hypothetical protein [Oligoflexus tunisiensis]|uniref:hypothetical protein n=1 Tax=Oligoflexus tunisiensis TaxID=708132 RepID=UPI00114D080D|nr:hypothetical protein [Oligoflexus tunisiensis]